MGRESELTEIDDLFSSLLDSERALSGFALRQLFTKLTDCLRHFRTGHGFLIALLYKGLIEDILRNAFENVYIDLEALPALGKTINAIAESWSETRRCSAQGEMGAYLGWYRDLSVAADSYRLLSASPRRGTTVMVAGLKFILAPSGGVLLGHPIAEQERERELRAFPDLDATLLDPDSSPALLRWYSDQILQIRAMLQSADRDLTTICFIEKPFSSVGALTLSAHLVNTTGVAAAIYRAGHWDVQTRLVGPRPDVGGTAVIVYDVAISGFALCETARFLREQLQVQTVGAVVAYDFDSGAATTLQREADISLFAFCHRTDVAPVLRAHEARASVLEEKFSEFVRRTKDERQDVTEAEIANSVRSALVAAHERYREALRASGTDHD